MQEVIEIPNKVYGLLKYFEEVIKLVDEKEDDDVKTILIRAVVNGIPLDDVKAEIRKHCERYMDGDIIADEVIQAVDRIGKAERSDKDKK